MFKQKMCYVWSYIVKKISIKLSALPPVSSSGLNQVIRKKRNCLPKPLIIFSIQKQKQNTIKSNILGDIKKT